MSATIKNINQADYNILLAHATGKTKEFIFTHPEYKLSLFERLRLKYFIHLRSSGIPIAYITKHKEFYDLDFIVNKHTLVPRPETEMMVDNVLYIVGHVLRDENNKILLIDVGTGSGCIPISIATMKQCNLPRRQAGNEAMKFIYHSPIQLFPPTAIPRVKIGRQ